MMRCSVLRRDEIGFVFQAYNLVPVLSAEENVALPAVIVGEKASAYTERLDDVWLDSYPLGHRSKLPSRAASSNGSPSRARSSAGHDRLRRRAHRQPRLASGAEVLDLLRRSAATTARPS